MNKASVSQQAKTASLLSPVQGLLQRQCACGNHTLAGGECAECAKNKDGLQRKLAIGASNDPLELEADRVADQVMAASGHTAVSGAPLHIQRYAGQATEGLETAPASVDRVLASSGRPLEPALRQDMGQRFGYDFSRVRVHSGAAAEQSARDVSANAYTVGHNIVFGAGRFAPGTNEGRRLIAHELTHVLQQKDTAGYPVPTIQQRGASAVLQRESDEPESGRAEPDWAPWVRSTPMDALPGDPAKGYEKPRTSYTEDDKDRLSKLLWLRERDNKKRAGAFIGNFGEALTVLWGKQVTETMKEAGEDAGWSFAKNLLKFVVIKGCEWALAPGLSKAGAVILEAFEVKISEKVLEKASEAGIAYYLENVTERMEEKKKGSQLDEKKEDLDSITERFGTLMEKLPDETLSSLPDIQPYSEWLRHAQMYQLAKFRLPPLFPDVKKSEIRAIVAGLIVSKLHGLLKLRSGGIHIGLQTGYPDPRDPTRVDYYDDDIIVVRNMNQAQIYSPSPEIVKAIAGQVPISKIPHVPLYIIYGGDDMAAAKRLMTAFRNEDDSTILAFDLGYNIFGDQISSAVVSEKESENFLKAYGASGNVVVTRNPAWEIDVSGQGLAGNLKLYMAGTGDSNLAKLSSDVLIWAQGESEYRRKIGKAPDEGVSRLVDAADLAVKTRSYLDQEDKKRVAWAKTLITNEIEKLVPQNPVDRWSMRAPTR